MSKDVLLFTFLLLYQNISDGFVHFIIQVSVGSHLITSFTSFDILSFLNSSSSNVARQELCYNSNTLLSNCDHIRVNVFVYEMAQESAVGKKKKKVNKTEVQTALSVKLLCLFFTDRLIFLFLMKPDFKFHVQ